MQGVVSMIAAVVAERNSIDESVPRAADLVDEAAVDTARRSHLAKLARFQAVVEVPRCEADTRPLTTRWVDRADEFTVKSRLTAHGFKQQVAPGTCFYAGTPASPSMRLLLALAAKEGLLVGAGDSQSAFLQAPLREAVWIEPPAEAGLPKSTVWRACKAFPGLRGSPVAWGDYADSVLARRHGLVRSRVDVCLYSLGNADRGRLWLLRHLDDFLCAGSSPLVRALLADMQSSLLLEGVCFLAAPGDKLRFLGVDILRTAQGFRVACAQELVQEVLAELGLQQARPAKLPAERPKATASPPLNEADHRRYRSVVGRLLWLCSCRPDLQFAVGRCARAVHAPQEHHWAAVKRIGRYLAGAPALAIHLAPRGPWRLEAHVDADWATEPSDRRSVSGCLVLLGGMCVHSHSRTQSATALSSCESELYALSSGCAELLFVAAWLEEQRVVVPLPLAHCDSESAIAMAYKAGPSTRLKHVALRQLAVQDWTRERRVGIKKIGTADNGSDFLTKAVGQDALTVGCSTAQLVRA